MGTDNNLRRRAKNERLGEHRIGVPFALKPLAGRFSEKNGARNTSESFALDAIAPI